MTDPRPFAESEPEAGVDAILRDDALLDALGRGELPATYRADVTARLLTSWRDDLDEGLPPLVGSDRPSPVMLATAWDDTDVLPLFSDEPAFTDPDRIDESVRSAFVAAGYARPSEELPPVRIADEPTQQFQASFDRVEDEPPAPETETRRRARHSRRRRLDRVVVAAAAVAAVLAAGSAGSVAAAATAHPGDTLWPISRVIYAERAKSIEASRDAHVSLRKAREAMKRGDVDAARKYYKEAQDKLSGQVREGSDEADRLAQDLETTAAQPDFKSQPGEPWYRPTPDPSSSSGASSSPSSPSSRSNWQRRGPRSGGTTTTTVPTPPATGTTPTPGGQSTPPSNTGGPTTSSPDPDPTTQGPTNPTPTDSAGPASPTPSDSSSSGGGVPDGQTSSGAQNPESVAPPAE